MAHKDDIIAFLKSDPAIQKVNFDFGGFLVYPQAYAVDVAGLIGSGRIGIRITTALDDDAGASYFADYNEIWVPPSFSIGKDEHCSLLVHEATHAHMDYKAVGTVDIGWSEAIAYLAEAVFREARGLGPMSANFIRQRSHATAKAVVGGAYRLDPAQVNSLILSARSEPHYAEKPPTIRYDGF